MKKNILFLITLVLVHVPLLPIGIGACSLIKDGHRIDMFGEMHIQPASKESELFAVIQKQHSDLIKQVKKYDKVELLVEGMTLTDERQRQNIVGGDGLVFLSDLPSVAKENGIDAKNIEWRDNATGVCYLSQMNYLIEKTLFLLAMDEMRQHAKGGDLNKLSSLESKYSNQENFVCSSEDARELFVFVNHLFEESILDHIDKAHGKYVIVCVGLAHMISLRNKLKMKGYVDFIEPVGQIEDNIIEKAEEMFKAFYAKELQPLNIEKFLNQKDSVR